MAASSYAHHVRTLGWNGPSSCIPNNGLPIRAGGTVSTWPISCAGHHDSPSLAGGLCTMDADGIHCQQLRATGRVPDINAAGIVLFHSDAYRIIRRELGGAEHDLGDGAFAVWTVDGAIVYQGLGGRLFRMAADGRAREPLEPAAAYPTWTTAARSSSTPTRTWCRCALPAGSRDGAVVEELQPAVEERRLRRRHDDLVALGHLQQHLASDAARARREVEGRGDVLIGRDRQPPPVERRPQVGGLLLRLRPVVVA